MYDLSFSDAIEDRRLKRAERSYVYHFRKNFREAMTPAAEALGLDQESKEEAK
jgi:hypothetical protein